MFKRMLFNLKLHKVVARRLGLFALASLAVIVASFGLLHVAYHPGLIYQEVRDGVVLIWDHLPGRELFHITYSPLSLVIFTLGFWATVTQKHAWNKFRFFCVRTASRVWNTAFSTTFLASLTIIGMTLLLFKEMKSEMSGPYVGLTVVTLQYASYLLVTSLRRNTIPNLKSWWRRFDVELTATDELREGKNVKRNRKILQAVATEREGEKSVWQKPTLLS